METTVSVIIPFYNAEEHFSRCIESLLAQKLEGLEFIFVDDHGSDRSLGIVQEYAKSDARIRIIQNETSLGAGPSRNRGIAEAHGEYLSFVDADDYLSPDFYELLYQTAVETKCDIAKGTVQFIGPSDDYRCSLYANQNGMISKKLSEGQPLYSCFNYGHQSGLYKTELIREHAIEYGETQVGEDNIFLLRFCLQTDNISFNNDALYYYVHYEQSACNKNDIRRHREGLKALQERIRILQNKGLQRADYVFLAKSANYYLTEYENFAAANGASGQEIADYLTDFDAIVAQTDSPEQIVSKLNVYSRLNAIRVDSVRGQKLQSTNVPVENHESNGKTIGNKPKVSIVIPLYKCSDFLPDMFNMVCGQSFQDIEIICVLDGPDDEARAIVEDWAKKDERIILLEQEHDGAGAARNTGLEKARGDYLLFLDADDTFSPQLVEKLYNKAIKLDADIVMCTYKELNERTKTTKMGLGFDRSSFLEESVTNPADVRVLYHGTSHAPWNKLFLRRFIIDKELRFSHTMVMNDAFFVLAALACSNRITIIKEDLLTVRRYINNESISSNREKHSEDAVTVARQLYQWLKQKGLWEQRREDYYRFMMSALHYQSKYPYNEKFVDSMARTLSAEQPWKSMCNAELVDTLGMRIADVQKIQQNQKDTIAALRDTDTSGREHDLYMTENKLSTFRKIRARMKNEYGRDLSKHGNPFKWIEWSIRTRGARGTLRKIWEKKQGPIEIRPSAVTCAGHITMAGHYIACFLPLNTTREKAEVIDLSVVVRCNGYYPLAVSGKNNDVFTALGAGLTPVFNSGASRRNGEVMRVHAWVSPGLGIGMQIRFTESLLKNKKGDKVDNNHPVSIVLSGLIRLT